LPQGFWGLARSHERPGPNVHERSVAAACRRGDAARPKRLGQKKWPLRGAAKFREETPRKGGGFAIKDRNTALQQYEEMPLSLQAQNQNFFKIFSRRNPRKTCRTSA
jgi:hypothetical protein